ncbi:MAG: aspartyl/glutamyl-tRNA amidotransferase subunit A [Nanoarchaeota archaeon]|nr:aspartyl/glutamyl-tRNA amidotransferase subunit A [Nanoarchaeota archaeon]
MVVLEKLKSYLKKIKEKNKELNIFLELRSEKELIEEAKEIDAKIKKGVAGRLAGYVVGVKPNINVLGLKASCASKTLENYESTYDAEVIRRVKKEDGLIIGMTNCDEFASGSSGETSAFGPCKNPKKPELIPGGSSSGSAAAVAAGMCDVSLGSDTGGSIRNPSSHCGVVGIKPTYGSVSRHGLIDLSMSLDQIGPFANNVYDAALLLDVIRGKDEKDSISVESKKFELENLEKPRKKFKIGYLDFESFSVKGDERINRLIKDRLDEVIGKFNLEVPTKLDKSKLDLMKFAVQIYYPIVYTEFFSGTRKFDGRRYGKKIEDSCGPEVLRRILGGAEITRAEHDGRNYHLALRAKKSLEITFREIFQEKDVLVLPVVPRLPHKIGEEISVEEMYAYDVFTIPANLAGVCSMVVPAGEIEGIPVGVQIMADKFNEQKMLEFASLFEK